MVVSKPKASYSISELAREFDLTTRAIRHYEDEGLISPQRIGSRNAARRVYTPRERVRIMLILRGKRLGMSLTEIKALFDLYDADKTERAQLTTIIEMLDARRNILEQQRRDIAEVLAEIDDVYALCKQRLLDKTAQ